MALSLLAGCAETTDSAFSQGMIAVKKDGLWGFADESGEIVIDCKYDSVNPFYGAYAAVSMGGRTFLIGTDGEDAGIEIARLDDVNKERTLMIVKDKHTGLYGALDTSSGEWKTVDSFCAMVTPKRPRRRSSSRMRHSTWKLLFSEKVFVRL